LRSAKKPTTLPATHFGPHAYYSYVASKSGRKSWRRSASQRSLATGRSRNNRNDNKEQLEEAQTRLTASLVGRETANDARDAESSLGRRGETTMTRKESILKLRDLLVTRRDALRKALAGDLSLLKQLREQTGGDVIDAALDAAQDEISSQLAEVESRELANIERALLRIRKGSYGECEACGNKIPLARLNALPYATSCIECQRAAETSGGAGGGSGDWSRVLDTGFVDTDVSFSDLEM
jgi:DnaK suppressor protein